MASKLSRFFPSTRIFTLRIPGVFTEIVWINDVTVSSSISTPEPMGIGKCGVYINYGNSRIDEVNAANLRARFPRALAHEPGARCPRFAPVFGANLGSPHSARALV